MASDHDSNPGLAVRTGTAAEPDYPAAHSMDTGWFAIDQDGYVAMLSSNEEGAVPRTCQQDSGTDKLDSISQATGKAPTKTRWNSVEPASLGLFDFQWSLGEGPLGEVDDLEVDELPVMPYKKMAEPQEPVHISQLPAHLQTALSEYKFKDVSFKDTTWLQPALHIRCQFWTQEDYGDLQIVDAEGNIVKLPPDML